jgi:hypothetical protein
MSDNSDRLCDEIIQILTPKIGDHRVLKVWKDDFAGYFYVLEEYRLSWYFKKYWYRKPMYTCSIEVAQRWADHYKVRIQKVTDDEA